jgi:hypothetical protein
MNEIDIEIQAITKITEALSSLDTDATERVLRYINQRYQIKVVSPGPIASPSLSSGQDGQTMFSEFHELFDAAQPVSAVDRALVVGYWFQKVLGKTELDSFLLNKELKNLGYPSSNITRDLDGLMKKTPRLITQTGKGGNSQQARKTYKLTAEGIKAVEKMIADHQTVVNV